MVVFCKLYRHAVTIRNVKTHKLTVDSFVNESCVDLVEDGVISICILAQQPEVERASVVDVECELYPVFG